MFEEYHNIRKYLVYKITNLISGKIYVGKTTRTIQIRWCDHCETAYDKNSRKFPINRAIYKYGKENFKIEIIEECFSKRELKIRENFWIKTLNSLDNKIGYNLLYVDCSKEKAIARTKIEKAINRHQRNIKRKINQYRGVAISIPRCGIGKTWYCHINFLGKSYKKRFGSEVMAAEAYDKLALFLYKNDAIINFPDKKDIYLKYDLQDYFSWFTKKKEASSKYRGIKIRKENQKYRAQINIKNKRICLGDYSSEEEAAKIRDLVYYFLYKDSNELNFPDYIQSLSKQEIDDGATKLLNGWTDYWENQASKYRWVHRENNNWTAKVYFQKKSYYLGIFLTEKDAAITADKKAKELGIDKNKLNFP